MAFRRFLAPLAIGALIALAGPALATLPDEILPDPAQEARARALGKHLRCVVCQNQSIDDSNAELARDLRILVRDRIKAGDTDEAAMDFIVARYGNFVLLKPPLQLNTLLLWFAPGIMLLIALGCYWTFVRGSATRADAGPGDMLTAAERKELDAILKKG